MTEDPVDVLRHVVAECDRVSNLIDDNRRLQWRLAVVRRALQWLVRRIPRQALEYRLHATTTLDDDARMELATLIRESRQ